MPKAKLGIWGAESIVHNWAENLRVVRPRDLVHAKIPHTWLYVVGDLGMTRVARGLYVRAGDTVDPLILMARKYPRLTLGLTSALWAHRLLPARPTVDWWVMGIKDKRPSLPCVAHFVRSTWPQEDRQDIRLFATTISVQTVPRALLECVRVQRRLGREAVLDLVRRGLKSESVTVDGLKELAKERHVYAPLRALLRDATPG